MKENIIEMLDKLDDKKLRMVWYFLIGMTTSRR